MSCLSIRLPTAKKVWKSFTSKLQTRLHKLHNSKAIIKKQPNNTINHRLHTAAAASKTIRPSLFLGQRLQRNRRKHRRALPFGYQRYYLPSSKNKLKGAAAAPVYIDKLFKEAQVAELVGYSYINPQQQQQPSEKKSEKNIVKLILDEAASVAEAGDHKTSSNHVGDDHMGESTIGLASPSSPILHGIDARAEEFIASFRAEMERQEIIARNL